MKSFDYLSHLSKDELKRELGKTKAEKKQYEQVLAVITNNLKEIAVIVEMLLQKKRVIEDGEKRAAEAAAEAKKYLKEFEVKLAELNAKEETIGDYLKNSQP